MMRRVSPYESTVDSVAKALIEAVESADCRD